MADPPRVPLDMSSGGQYVPHLHQESNIGIVNELSEPALGQSDSVLAKTEKGTKLGAAKQSLVELKRRPIRNFFKIHDAKNSYADALSDYKQFVGVPAADDEQWRRENPHVPEWTHKPSFYVNRLYRELRGFNVEAEHQSGTSPGLALAQKGLHWSQLSAADQKILINYFGKHEWHDCKDHSTGTYWSVQSRLSAVVAKIPTMSEPVTVWRGESYGTGTKRTDAEKLGTIARIHYLQSLQPGDPFTWDNCAATSLRVHTAARKFSGSRRPEEFRVVDPGLGVQPANHSVLFELETDRGVYIDDALTNASHSNEDEVLLPTGMPFKVVGHTQLELGGVSSSVFHLIKLKLETQ